MPDIKSIGDQIAALDLKEAVALCKYLRGLDPPSGCIAILVPSGGGPVLSAEAVPELENEDA